MSLLARTPNDDGNHLDFNIYGYVPSLAAGAVFIALFSLLTIAHLAITIKSRVWWTVVIAVGGICEILGWVGRLWSNLNIWLLTPFLLQQILLILAPCFFSAALYAATGALIRVVGPQFSILRPNLYLIVFCLADLCAIVVQAVGGAMAAIALGNGKESFTGTHIMVAGIVIQLAAMIAFAIVVLDFFRKARRDSSYSRTANAPGSRINTLFAALTAGTVLIIIRGIYRTIELAQGWSGYLITHEPYFIALDAIMMLLASIALIFVHPSLTLPKSGAMRAKESVVSEQEKGSF